MSIHTAPPDEVTAFQTRALRKLIWHLACSSPYYQQVFSRLNINPLSINTLADLNQIPFTTKQDLQQHNDAFRCVPRTRIIDYVCTSGTLGKPVTFGLTERDLQRLAHNEATALEMTGGGPHETYLLTTTLDKRFMAGLAYFLGARQLGAGIIRSGVGIIDMQWEYIQTLRPTALIGVPSFMVKLLEYAEKHGINPKRSSIQKLICIGESVRNADFSLNNLGQRLYEKWGLPLFSTYASTEMGAAFTECEAGCGGHHNPELLVIDVIDSQGQSVAEGGVGELVVTTLGVEGMPLLRFRTGDLVRLHREPCRCGRTSARISPVVGRCQQMIKFKGTTLYPQTIYDALNQLEDVRNYIVEVSSTTLNTDELLVRVGIDGALSDTFAERVRQQLKSKLRVSPVVSFEPSADIQRMQFPQNARKPITFIDNRQLAVF